MDSSENPIRLLNFAFSLYQQPYWIGLSQLLLADLSWLASTRIPVGRLTAYIRFFVKRYSLPHAGHRGWHQHYLANDFTQGGIVGRQSLLYAKACHFVRPLYRSDLSISCLADWPFTSGLSYRLLPPYMPDITTWPLRTIVRVGLSPTSSTTLLAAIPLPALYSQLPDCIGD